MDEEKREIIRSPYLPKEKTALKALKPRKKYEKKRAIVQLQVDTLVLNKDGRPDTSKLTDRQMMAISGFRKYRGNVTLACKHSGCSRDTFYRWMNENKVFAHLAERAKAESGDVVENMLWERIDRGDPWAIQFWLKHNHPNYADKLAVTVKALTPSWANKMKIPTKAPLNPKQIMGIEHTIKAKEERNEKKNKEILDATLGNTTVPRLPAV